jgi:hypothetical protein
VTIVPEPRRKSVWPAPSEFRQASVIWIVASGWRVAPPEAYFQAPAHRGSLPIVVRGREIRRFQFWTAEGFRQPEGR